MIGRPEQKVSIVSLKSLVQKSLPANHPARLMILSAGDNLSVEEYPLLVKLALDLLDSYESS
jgi:hypothetical protein